MVSSLVSPIKNGYVIVATVLRGKNGWTQISRGLECLLFRTSVDQIPERNHIMIVVIDTGAYATTSECDGGGYVYGNFLRGTPTQSIPRHWKPVDPGGSLSVRCPNSGPPGRRNPYLGISSELLSGLMSGPRLTLVGMPQLEAFDDLQQCPRISPRLACGSVLT